MNPYRLILPLGILTYITLLLTILIAKRVIKVHFKYHKLFGLITFLLATTHAVLAIYLNYFR